LLLLPPDAPVLDDELVLPQAASAAQATKAPSAAPSLLVDGVAYLVFM
jgi:hypothetical protein